MYYYLYCTRRYLIRWVALLHTGDGLQWIRKHTIFNEHSCIFLTLGQSVLLVCSAEFASESEFVRWTARGQIGNWRQIWQRSEKSQYLKGKNTIFLDTLYTMNRISYWYKRERDICIYLCIHRCQSCNVWKGRKRSEGVGQLCQQFNFT